MRGALTGEVSEAHRNYHIPISNTAAATMVLENRPIVQRKAARLGRALLRETQQRPRRVGWVS